MNDRDNPTRSTGESKNPFIIELNELQGQMRTITNYLSENKSNIDVAVLDSLRASLDGAARDAKKIILKLIESKTDLKGDTKNLTEAMKAAAETNRASTKAQETVLKFYTKNSAGVLVPKDKSFDAFYKATGRGLDKKFGKSLGFPGGLSSISGPGIAASVIATIVQEGMRAVVTAAKYNTYAFKAGAFDSRIGSHVGGSGKLISSALSGTSLKAWTANLAENEKILSSFLKTGGAQLKFFDAFNDKNKDAVNNLTDTARTLADLALAARGAGVSSEEFGAGMGQLQRIFKGTPKDLKNAWDLSFTLMSRSGMAFNEIVSSLSTVTRDIQWLPKNMKATATATFAPMAAIINKLVTEQEGNLTSTQLSEVIDNIGKIGASINAATYIGYTNPNGAGSIEGFAKSIQGYYRTPGFQRVADVNARYLDEIMASMKKETSFLHNKKTTEDTSNASLIKHAASVASTTHPMFQQYGAQGALISELMYKYKDVFSQPKSLEAIFNDLRESGKITAEQQSALASSQALVNALENPLATLIGLVSRSMRALLTLTEFFTGRKVEPNQNEITAAGAFAGSGVGSRAAVGVTR